MSVVTTFVFGTEVGPPNRPAVNLDIIYVDAVGTWYRPFQHATRDQTWTTWTEVKSMPFFPAPSTPASTPTAIDETLAVAGTAEDLVTVPVGLQGQKISLVNRGPGDAAIAFDATATVASVLIKAGESYSEDGVAIAEKISYINVTAGKKPRLTGVLWSA